MSDFYMEGISDASFWDDEEWVIAPYESDGVVQCEECGKEVFLDVHESTVYIGEVPRRNADLLDSDSCVTFSWDCPNARCDNWVAVTVALPKGSSAKNRDKERIAEMEAKDRRIRTKYKGARKVIKFPIHRTKKEKK